VDILVVAVLLVWIVVVGILGVDNIVAVVDNIVVGDDNIVAVVVVVVVVVVDDDYSYCLWFLFAFYQIYPVISYLQHPRLRV
jgi:surface polysaccharide O-acyltransferase-like enzyme